MNALLEAILTFTNWIWGIPMLILLVGGGCFLAVRLNMLPYRKLPFILTHTIGKSFTKIEGSDGQFSGWQAASGALASTLGAGNIVGTAMAIAFGGPGSVFWLWIAGLAACAVKYTEVTTAMLYREIDQKGNWVGGPQYYLGNATGWKRTGELYTIQPVCPIFRSFCPIWIRSRSLSRLRSQSYPFSPHSHPFLHCRGCWWNAQSSGSQ